MSTDSLRALLHDRVADETTVDLSTRAWRAGRRSRRRRSLAVVGGVAAGAVAASGVVVWVDSTPPRDDAVAPSPADTTPTQTPTTPTAVTAGPDATYEGTPVWFTPDPAGERELPFVDAPLPRAVDAQETSCPDEQLTGPIRLAIASGAVVRVFDADGVCDPVDISRLDDVTTPAGDRVAPTSASMLSPEGDYLMFPQDGAVAVYTLATEEWLTIDTDGRPTYGASWLDRDRIAIPYDDGAQIMVLTKPGPGVQQEDVPPIVPSFSLPADVAAYGPTHATGSSYAQAWGRGLVGLPAADPAGPGGPEFLAVLTAEVNAALTVTGSIAADDIRDASCCPVAGWLDERTVVYESRQDEATLVAWTVGTREFRRVATIEGTYDVASYADLS